MGRDCDIEKDFKTTFTDLGLCFTFNGNPDKVKFVDDTTEALSLILNVEQYEHMRGPQNDAGLKVSVHMMTSVVVFVIISLYKPTTDKRYLKSSLVRVFRCVGLVHME